MTTPWTKWNAEWTPQWTLTPQPSGSQHTADIQPLPGKLKYCFANEAWPSHSVSNCNLPDPSWYSQLPSPRETCLSCFIHLYEACVSFHELLLSHHCRFNYPLKHYVRSCIWYPEYIKNSLPQTLPQIIWLENTWPDISPKTI